MTSASPVKIMEGKPAFNHTAHKALWNWLADHPDACKEDWPGWHEVEDTPVQLCYACQYTHSTRAWEVYIVRGLPVPRPENIAVDCARCPLDWGNGKHPSCIPLYTDWKRSCLPPAARAIAARRIADAPVHQGVEVI